MFAGRRDSANASASHCDACARSSGARNANARLEVAQRGTCAKIARSMCSLPCPKNEAANAGFRSEEHTSELQSLMRISYAVFCLQKKKKQNTAARRENDRLNIQHNSTT